LVSIPVTHENNLHVISLCPFFPFAQWRQWHTVIIYRLLFTEVRQQPGRRFQVSTIFLLLFLCQNSSSIVFWWKESFKQVHRHYL